MDNYYTSLSLFVDMKLKGLGACGTTHVDRKRIPLEWKPKAKGKGQTGEKKKRIEERRSKNREPKEWRTWLAMKDKWLITILSGVHNSSMVKKNSQNMVVIYRKRKCREATNG